VNRPLSRRVLAEAAGTAILVGIGTGAMVATSGLTSLRIWLLPWAWFAAVTIPVGLFASVSGAHLNPAVSLAVALRGKLPAGEAVAYTLAQFSGAFAGSGLVLLTLGPADHLGATFPVAGVLPAFLGEVALTFLLILVVLFLVDHGPGRSRWRLLLPGAVVALSTYVIGPWSRSSLNPARTLAPAVLSMTFNDLWLYFAAPASGALLALLVWQSRRLSGAATCSA
jgi:glycerol uptake facilitator-like aquaporin